MNITSSHLDFKTQKLVIPYFRTEKNTVEENDFEREEKDMYRNLWRNKEINENSVKKRSAYRYGICLWT